MIYRLRAMAFAMVCVLCAGIGFLAISTLFSLGGEEPFKQSGLAAEHADSLDPNDCSRPIDESNQETCDEVVE